MRIFRIRRRTGLAAGAPALGAAASGVSALALSVLAVSVLAGCAPEAVQKPTPLSAAPDALESPGSAASPDVPASPDALENEGAVRDLSQGGTCESGESIAIGTAGAAPIVTGDCGSVTVAADDVSGNIETAESVTISGSGTMLLGERWGALSITGAGSGANVDEIVELSVSADKVHVTNTRLRSAVIEGSEVTVNTDGIDRLTVNGDRSSFIVSGPIAEFEVHGDDNVFNWGAGAEAPSSDTGSGNRYTR